MLFSSEATRSRAKKLSDEIGSWYLDVHIDTVVSALISLFEKLTGKRPRYKVRYITQSIVEIIFAGFRAFSG